MLKATRSSRLRKARGGPVLGLALALTFLVLAPVALVTLAPHPALAAETVDEALFRELEDNLMCTDGCGMALKNCDNATAQKMRSELRQKIGEGASKEEIYAYMISVYGEEVMAAPPPKHPLNIAAWVLPFVGILAGGATIYMAVDKWVFDRGHKRDPADELDAAELAAYDEIVDKEIKKYY